MSFLSNLFQGQLWNPATFSGAVAYLIVFLLIALLLTRFLQKVIEQTLKHDSHGRVDRTAASFLMPLSRIAIFAVAFMLYAHIIPPLQHLGTALLTGVSISAVVIGLAAQNTLGNFVSGLSLLLYRPFSVGDRLEVNAPQGTETGTVESITLGYTILQTFDNRRVVIPNSLMSNQVTINLTRLTPRVMAMVPIGISYEADIDRTRQILLELAQNHSLVQEVVNCPIVQLGNSSVNLSLRAWCENPLDAKQVEYDLYEQAKKRFDTEGIEIPYPYSNVIVKAVPQAKDA